MPTNYNEPVFQIFLPPGSAVSNRFCTFCDKSTLLNKNAFFRIILQLWHKHSNYIYRVQKLCHCFIFTLPSPRSLHMYATSLENISIVSFRRSTTISLQHFLILQYQLTSHYVLQLLNLCSYSISNQRNLLFTIRFFFCNSA